MRRTLPILMLAAMLLLLGARGAVATCFPVYGNWCGDDYPKAGTNPPTRDVFDLACKRHDKCYERQGAGDGSCDRAFVRELRGLHWQYRYLPRPLQWAERYFSLKTGQPVTGGPMPMPGDMMGVLGSLLADCD